MPLRTSKKALRRRDRRRGFTAMEIAMVATVIAILALIVLPIFRNRVEDAKVAAAKSDITTLMKAETLVKADASFYVRLEDLDNGMNNDPPTPPATGITLETPPFVYQETPPAQRRVLTQAEWHNLAGTKSSPKFKGPYATLPHIATYLELRQSTIAPYVLRSVTTDPASPVWDIPENMSTTGLFDANENRIPIDPWGNPYLFFPATGETGYTNSVIYCLGPDGLPGSLSGGSYQDYLRGAANGLGNGDDMQVQF